MEYMSKKIVRNRQKEKEHKFTGIIFNSNTEEELNKRIDQAIADKKKVYNESHNNNFK